MSGVAFEGDGLLVKSLAIEKRERFEILMSCLSCSYYLAFLALFAFLMTVWRILRVFSGGTSMSFL